MREPIKFEDIRVGDRVEATSTYVDGTTDTRTLTVAKKHGKVVESEYGYMVLSSPPENMTKEWFLLERPEPNAELIERMAKAICDSDSYCAWFGSEITNEHRDMYLSNAKAALNVILEMHDLVQKEDSAG